MFKDFIEEWEIYLFKFERFPKLSFRRFIKQKFEQIFYSLVERFQRYLQISFKEFLNIDFKDFLGRSKQCDNAMSLMESKGHNFDCSAPYFFAVCNLCTSSLMDQLDRPDGQTSWRDQFFLFEVLASSHIWRLTFQFVHCRSFRVQQRPCFIYVWEIA